MTSEKAYRISAVLGFAAVALGAFGAHGMKGILAEHGTAAAWETAVFYHFMHAVVMFCLAAGGRFKGGVWWCFFVGIVLFSGSLYLLAGLNLKWLGAVTPLGGLSFLAGWGWLAWTGSGRRGSTGERVASEN